MPFIADLHTHSKYARACSPRLTLPNMQAWCQLKGVDLLSCADFTHPKWFQHLSEVFEEVKEGVYRVKPVFQEQAEITVPEKCRKNSFFILGTEISLIYKKNDKLRRIHLLVFAPNLQVVERINKELDKRGNLTADGRPILGLDSEELLKILLSISPEIEVIPAHIWTPHFAIFGSKSGFDSVEECFGSMAQHINALETGLSSDPAMNWRLSQNDQYALISCSDAHSPQKFGREATVFNTEMNYKSLINTIRNEHENITETIEFFPEEGKYHADGIRAEKLCFIPAETKANYYSSPATGKVITVGVLHRIEDLADKEAGRKNPQGRPFCHIIPLPEILSEILGVGPQSKTVETLYFHLLEQLGPEFSILKDLPISEISAVDERVGEAIRRMRAREVDVTPGYDGVYGNIKLFKQDELKELKNLKNAQASLF